MYQQNKTNMNANTNKNYNTNKNNNDKNTDKAVIIRQKDEVFFKKIEENYAVEAENVIVELLKSNNNKLLTTSKIRNILSLINEVGEKVVFAEKNLDKKIQNEILYIRVKLAYLYGRSLKEKVVIDFINESKLIELVMCIGDSKEKFQAFAKYVEALVAYHKFYGGKDD